ncbi:hypothetical protein E2C01_093446 [Portunus trituberculatus]|uniref:Uncharacterized protein n=1 Tax=Portunus trituberculatus TaxID=210409 RepID=A0A5B7K0I6_PORTR|nr:hypothetical protein [Portunus trituberculatus]
MEGQRRGRGRAEEGQRRRGVVVEGLEVREGKDHV